MYTYEMDSTKLLSSKIEMINVLLFNLVNKHGETFAKCSEIVANGLKNDKTIFWCGNGGSAAESSHLAVELIGRFKNNRRSLPSLSLNADTSAITCIANDFGYDEIFARQLEGLGKQGDVLIVLSSSGKSENILRVLRKAKEIGIPSIALLGKGGGQAVALSDFAIVIESEETARIQEMHLLLGHTLCEYAEIALGIA
jgi:D-sedoheptulose 7-phosphate isomerase